MIDKDSWDIESLAQSVGENGYFLAVSNPCFELWLVLHFGDYDPEYTHCKDLKKRLRAYLGHHRLMGSHRPLYPLASILEAIERAKLLDTGSDQLCPDFPATHVYRLVEKLIEFGQS